MGMFDFVGDIISTFTDPIGSALGFGSTEEREDAAEQQEKITESSLALNDLITQITRAYYQQTSPLRDSIMARAGNILGGNFKPSSSPLFAPMKGATEDAYGTARTNLLSTLPSGGMLMKGLTDLEGGRARSLTDIMAQILSDEYNKAWGLGTSATPLTLQGFTQATNPLNTAMAGGGSLLSAAQRPTLFQGAVSGLSQGIGQAFGKRF